MQLPNSSQPTLAWFCANTGFVNVSSLNSTPTVESMLDRISGLGAVQTTLADQPTFQLSTTGVPSDYSSLAFDGTDDCLTFDGLASTLGTFNSFTVFMAASTTAPATAGMDLFSLGKAAADGYIQMFIDSSKAGFSTKDDSAVVAAPSTAGTVDTAVHLYTLVKDGSAGTVSLRLDGTQIVSASVSGAFTVNTLTLGALRNNSTTVNFLNGNIMECAIVKGVADLTAVEDYFTHKYLDGLNRAV